MASIIINEKEYEVPTVDFNAICDLEALGVNIVASGSKTPICDIRSIAAWMMKTSKEKAGIELQEHLLKGGSIDEMSTVFEKELMESPFMKAVNLGVAPVDHKRRTKKATAE